eukprot:GHVH01014900.1.p1 GENE.GHVH01014900.1~~GHVH01014900.1.p1  ORF type:complete len:725 (-),score=108.58 GHVH01014900.1:4606-6780(-)
MGDTGVKRSVRVAVKIISGRGFSVENEGKADIPSPYVTVTCLGTAKSTPVKNEQSNPLWDYSESFESSDVTEAQQAMEFVEFNVYQKWYFSSQSLGYASVSLPYLRKSGNNEMNGVIIDVRDTKGHITGALTVSISIESTPAIADETTLDRTCDRAQETFRIRCAVNRVENLHFAPTMFGSDVNGWTIEVRYQSTHQKIKIDTASQVVNKVVSLPYFSPNYNTTLQILVENNGNYLGSAALFLEDLSSLYQWNFVRIVHPQNYKLLGTLIINVSISSPLPEIPMTATEALDTLEAPTGKEFEEVVYLVDVLECRSTSPSETVKLSFQVLDQIQYLQNLNPPRNRFNKDGTRDFDFDMNPSVPPIVISINPKERPSIHFMDQLGGTVCLSSQTDDQTALIELKSPEGAFQGALVSTTLQLSVHIMPLNVYQEKGRPEVIQKSSETLSRFIWVIAGLQNVPVRSYNTSYRVELSVESTSKLKFINKWSKFAPSRIHYNMLEMIDITLGVPPKRDIVKKICFNIIERSEGYLGLSETIIASSRIDIFDMIDRGIVHCDLLITGSSGCYTTLYCALYDPDSIQDFLTSVAMNVAIAGVCLDNTSVLPAGDVSHSFSSNLLVDSLESFSEKSIPITDQEGEGKGYLLKLNDKRGFLKNEWTWGHEHPFTFHCNTNVIIDPETGAVVPTFIRLELTFQPELPGSEPIRVFALIPVVATLAWMSPTQKKVN